MTFPLKPIGILKSKADKIPTNGLIAAWTYTAGSLIDISGNGKTLINVGATQTADRKLISNNAYNFNGSHYMYNSSDVGLTGDITASVSLWFKKTSSGGGYKNIFRFGDPSIALGAFGMGTDLSATDDICIVFGGNNNHCSAGSVVSVGTWFNFIATKSVGVINTTTNMYIDNVLIAAISSPTTTPNVQVDAINVGRFLSTNYFAGDIDDIYVYNRVLTSSERNILYNA